MAANYQNNGFHISTDHFTTLFVLAIWISQCIKLFTGNRCLNLLLRWKNIRFWWKSFSFDFFKYRLTIYIYLKYYTVIESPSMKDRNSFKQNVEIKIAKKTNRLRTKKYSPCLKRELFKQFCVLVWNYQQNPSQKYDWCDNKNLSQI